MDGAPVHHDDFGCGEFVVREARGLEEDGYCDRDEPLSRIDFIEDLFWEVADSRERVYQRNQRGDSSEIAGGLAVLCVRRGFDYVEVRTAGEQSTYLESIELRNRSTGVS